MKKAKELSVVTYEMDQRFLFTGTKPSFSETFVKTTEISPRKHHQAVSLIRMSLV